MRALWILAAILATPVLASPAYPAVITSTYSGTVQNGSDGLGLFGGGSLVGREYSIDYDYDVARGILVTSPTEIALRDSPDGPAILAIRVTVSGLTFAFTPASSTLYSRHVGSKDETVHRASFSAPAPTQNPYNISVDSSAHSVEQTGDLISPIAFFQFVSTPASGSGFHVGSNAGTTFFQAYTAGSFSRSIADAEVPAPGALAIFALGALTLGARALKRREAS